jgi:hypothetical protein
MTRQAIGKTGTSFDGRRMMRRHASAGLCP